MWWYSIVTILAYSGVIMWRRGPVAALGSGTLVALLFPCWLVQDFLGTPIDLRIATSIVLLLANLVHPKSRIDWRFQGGDWAVLALYCVHVASDTWQDGFQLSHFVRAFGEWSIPYISGRLAIQSIQDWRWLTHVAAVIVAIFGLWAASEAVCKTNPGNLIFGARPVDRTDPMQFRAGFKRAEGPTTHAIWFGMLQMLCLPWVVTAAQRSARNDGPAWWFSVPVCSVAGILGAGSRGAQLSSLLVMFFTAVFFLRQYRKLLIVVGLTIAGIVLIARNQVLDALERVDVKYWNSQKQVVNIELDGQQHQFTAMSSRWLALRAYRPALFHAGLLGYGTERTSTFPVNVPLGPDAKQAVTKFWTIDCGYLLLALRFGWLGLAAFVTLVGLSIRHAMKQVQYLRPQEQIFLCAVAATLVSQAMILAGEWMPHDYGYLFLWLCGAANGPRLNGSLKHGGNARL